MPPELTAPDLWQQELVKDLGEGEAALQNWWIVFNYPVQSSLIQRATKENLDLAFC